MEKKKLIVSSPHPGLVRFMFPWLRLEERMPRSDGFFMVRDLSAADEAALSPYGDYVVVSRTRAHSEWGRDALIAHSRSLNGSRAKADHGGMPDMEFEEAAKVFHVSGKWPKAANASGMVKLFGAVDSKAHRWKELFALLDSGKHPEAVVHGLMTFAAKAASGDSPPAGRYGRTVASKKARLGRHLYGAVSNYAALEGADAAFRAARFVMDMGGGYGG